MFLHEFLIEIFRSSYGKVVAIAPMIEVHTVAVRFVEILAALRTGVALRGVVDGVSEANFPVVPMEDVRCQYATVGTLLPQRWPLVIYSQTVFIRFADILGQRWALLA